MFLPGRSRKYLQNGCLAWTVVSWPFLVAFSFQREQAVRFCQASRTCSTLSNLSFRVYTFTHFQNSWKATHFQLQMVNWQPIRQTSRIEGSVRQPRCRLCAPINSERIQAEGIITGLNRDYMIQQPLPTCCYITNDVGVLCTTGPYVHGRSKNAHLMPCVCLAFACHDWLVFWEDQGMKWKPRSGNRCTTPWMEVLVTEPEQFHFTSNIIVTDATN